MKNTNTLLEQLMASSSHGCTKNVYNSNVNIKNSDSEFIAEVILPGFSKKDISIFTDEGDVVIDPCAGSGTTLRACRELNRNSYGFEIERKFYNDATNLMLAPEEEQTQLQIII